MFSSQIAGSIFRRLRSRDATITIPPRFSYDDSGSEVSLEKQISENLKWRAYPLSKNVMQLFDSSIPAKYIPQTNSGYYFFYDMHKDSTDPFDDSKIFDRKDIKVVIALYIPEDRSLYIYDYHS